MKIKQVNVKNLFGFFDHEIPLNLSDRITIIHGPNGFGKTMLLTILYSLFTSDYHKLRNIPFSEFSLHFTDGSKLQLRKEIQLDFDQKETGFNTRELIFEFSKQGSTSPQRYIRGPIRLKEIPFPLDLIEREIPKLERIGSEKWFFSPSREIFSLDDVLERFEDRLPIPKSAREAEPPWFEEIINSIEVHFIESQRLLSFQHTSGSHQRYRSHEYERKPPLIPTVINYSDELVDMNRMILAEYASLSQSLDRSFPTRLVKGNSASKITEDELRTRLDELEKKRSRLMAAGFLDRKEEEIDFRELQKIDETNMKVLSIYVEDVEKKLSVFDDLTDKIDLLVKIINKKFLYKQMTIDKNIGFVFKTPDEKTIPVNSLSSGEQHELVLHYEILFHVKQDSLILIDEPELSLHVGWQREFLKNLEEITQLTGFDALIATHSPQIIHNRWDLTVELKGPKNEGISHSA